MSQIDSSTVTSARPLHLYNKGVQTPSSPVLKQTQSVLNTSAEINKAASNSGSSGKADGVENSFMQKTERKSVDMSLVKDSFNAAIYDCIMPGGSGVKNALSLVTNMKQNGTPPNRDTYNALIYACMRPGGGGVYNALSLVTDMKKFGIPLNGYTSVALINACAKAGLFDEAQALFAEMKPGDISLLKNSFNAAINACMRPGGGGVNNALSLMNDMKTIGIPLNGGTQL